MVSYLVIGGAKTSMAGMRVSIREEIDQEGHKSEEKQHLVYGCMDVLVCWCMCNRGRTTI